MLKFIQNNREITALLAVVLLFVLPGFLDRQYLSVQTLTMVYSSAQILILLAMGATLVMLTRNIDVSVGSITGMCAVLLGMLIILEQLSEGKACDLADEILERFGNVWKIRGAYFWHIFRDKIP